MARKYRPNRKNENVKSEPAPTMSGKTGKVVAVIAVVALAGIFAGLYHFGYLSTAGSAGGNTGTSGALPSSINTGEFAQVSQNNYAGSSSVDIYFLSWQGCPIGASDSWAIYSMLGNHYSGISSKVQTHTSDPQDVYPGTPGLLFSNFSFSSNGLSYNFHVVYVYGETLPSTGDLVTSGLATLNGAFPSQISALFSDYQTKVDASGYNKPIALKANHLTSSILISGKNGTFYLEGSLYSPGDLKGDSPSYVMGHLNSIQPIVSASSYLQKVVNTANA